MENGGEMEVDIVEKSFKDLGVNEQLIKACDSLGWKNPTNIQIAAIPLALQGEDIIGIAQTGSGKTGAFAIPIIQSLLETPEAFFACVLAPTREFAFRIARQFEALGAGIGLECALLTGGVGQVQQSIAPGNPPHVVVATPGCLIDHLSNAKGFSLRTLKYLILGLAEELSLLLQLDAAKTLKQIQYNICFEVVYEALHENFQKSDIDAILSAIPGDGTTFLFSSTMTNKIIVRNVSKESNGRKQKIGDVCAIFEDLKI